MGILSVVSVLQAKPDLTMESTGKKDDP